MSCSTWPSDMWVLANSYLANSYVQFHTENSYHILQIVQGGKVLRYGKLSCNSLENSWMVWSCMAKAYCTGYFTRKVLQLPIDLQKP